MKNDPTIERLDFNTYSQTTVEHLHRYAITHEFICKKEVLDIASGEGYGSYLMSNLATQVYGVDIDFNVINRAKEKYKRDNLKFSVGSADKIPLQDNSVDVVVSFETIEHHDMHIEMFEEIRRVLKPSGVMIMSSPDKEFYSDKSNYKNKFHIKELYFKDFKALVESYFNYSDFYFQKALNLNSYISSFSSFKKIDVYKGNQYKTKLQKIEPHYNIAVASNSNLVKLFPSIYNGEELMEKIIDQKIYKVKKSFTFKLGLNILKPFKYFSRIKS